MLGLIAALQPRERWALVAGAVAVLGAVGWAMHQSMHVEVNAIIALLYESEPEMSAALWTRTESIGTGMEDVTLLLMAAGLILGVLGLLGLALARVLPWWAFACAVAWVAITAAGGTSPVAAHGDLVLLAPFGLVALRLVRGDRIRASEAAEPVEAIA